MNPLQGNRIYRLRKSVPVISFPEKGAEMLFQHRSNRRIRAPSSFARLFLSWEHCPPRLISILYAICYIPVPILKKFTFFSIQLNVDLFCFLL